MHQPRGAGKRDSLQGSEHPDIELPSTRGNSTDLDGSSVRTLTPLLLQEPMPPAELARGGAGEGAFSRAFRFFIRNWTRFLLLITVIVLVILVSVKGLTVFGDILRFFQRQNNWLGWLYFTLLYCVNVALFLPGIVLILGAGFIFGFWKGFLAVWLGGGVGQALAFLLARYLVQDSVSVLVKGKWKKWEIIDKAIEQEGWKLLVLLRLSPVVPYNLLNITMAATKIHFWPFAIASFWGIIPECSLVCYLGSLATDLSQVISGDAGPKGPLTYVLAGITLLVIIGSATWATLFVRRAMRRAEANLRTGEADVEEGSAEDAGNDLHSPHNGLDPHHLQEDYIPSVQFGTDPASTPRRTSAAHRGSFSLLRTAALVAIPGLGSPGSTQVMMSDVLGGSMWERNRDGNPSGEELEGLDHPLERMDSLEADLLSPTSRSRGARMDD